MAFIAEDGTGLSNATSYVTEAEADTYWTDRNNTTWTSASTADKEVALIKATDYTDKRFGRKFLGFRSSSSQALEWPRLDAIDKDGYLFPARPEQLKKAVFEYALRALTAELVSDPATASTGPVKASREKVGPIEIETKFSSIGTVATKSSLVSGGNVPEYPAADMWLEELLDSSLSRRLARA